MARGDATDLRRFHEPARIASSRLGAKPPVGRTYGHDAAFNIECITSPATAPTMRTVSLLRRAPR
ncbi:hypothetical protein [Kitasatospora sp. MAP5-34]|uniref:hypothetical protein n=1 Tax=Kitasatospora sp. MAP5-34 TaxID=3035102 RepID=UPI00247710B6|nr:hypothetical protein [Kitasatospora sp. MAP5-34]MDH6579326.1 hypothetical protein [Kitasatospora sp. MAP5-34]